ncbi:MAG: TldD/PmbA family protein [Desulfurococcaceae archaeon TW002]
MLKDVALEALRIAEVLGASYAEVRTQLISYELVTVDNGVLREFSKTYRAGLGIRVLYNGSFGFSSTNELSRDSIRETVSRAITAARVSKKVGTLGERKPERGRYASSWKIRPEDVSDETKRELVSRANKAGLSIEGIKSSVSRLGIQHDWRYVVSTDGAELEYESYLIGVAHLSVAVESGSMERVSNQESSVAGWEFAEKKDWEEFTREVSKLAKEAVKAPLPPAGKMKVIADPEMVGLILHEAFGHATEGDLVASGTSILKNRLGEEVASPLVTIVDDGVVDGGYYVPFDDEGSFKTRTVVVEKGLLKSFLTNRESAARLNLPVSGNGRAQDFSHIPIVRQTNFFMMPGDWSLEEMIREVKEGLYLVGRGSSGGQVDTGAGTFTFSAGPSRIIRNGELGGLVRGVVVSGSILDTLRGVEAVGKVLRITTSVFGGCGKDFQMVRVGDGGPHILVKELIVGGD